MSENDTEKVQDIDLMSNKIINKIITDLNRHNQECSCTVNTKEADRSYYGKDNANPLRFIMNQNNHCTVELLTELGNAHQEYMDAKYELYKARSEFYTNKQNWDDCKEQTGKNTDGVFREYANNYLNDLKRKREEAEFEYSQLQRVYERL